MTQQKSSLFARITTDPGILSGKPIIRGTRMPVWIVIELIGIGQSNEEIVDDYPFLVADDVNAVRLLMKNCPGKTFEAPSDGELFRQLFTEGA